MAGKYYKLTIEKGASFSKTLLFGTGPIYKITGLADAGAGNIRATVPGHIFTDGQKIKIEAYNRERNIIYVGSYTIGGVVAGISFSFAATWQGSIVGTAQAARDLTGKSLRLAVREDYDDPAELFALTGAIPDPAGGVGTLSQTADVTGGYAVTSSAVHTCELFEAADATVVERVLYGDAVVTPEA